jgi:hypothetical protein
MDFEYSDKVKALQARLGAFMDEHVYPNERVFFDQIEENTRAGRRARRGCGTCGAPRLTAAS